MQTYYQKHKTIQATQFDGQWTTFFNLLPDEITQHIKGELDYKRTFIDWEIKDGRVQWVQLKNNYTIYWQPYFVKSHKHSYKRHATFIRKINAIKKKRRQRPNIVTNPNDRIITHKYDLIHRTLNYGDYIVLKTVYRPQIINLPFYPFTTEYQNNYIKQFQVWPKADFEAHWSKNKRK